MSDKAHEEVTLSFEQWYAAEDHQPPKTELESAGIKYLKGAAFEGWKACHYERQNEIDYHLNSLATLTAKLAEAELALLEAQCKNEALWKWLDGNAEHVPTCGHGAESGCTCGLSDLIYNNPDTSALSAHERRVCGEPVAEVISVDPITGIAKVQMAHQVNGYLIPKIGTKLCIAPTFTTAATTKGQSDVL